MSTGRHHTIGGSVRSEARDIPQALEAVMLVWLASAVGIERKAVLVAGARGC